MIVPGQSTFWRTYHDAGIKSLDQGEKYEGGSASYAENMRSCCADARKRFELARTLSLAILEASRPDAPERKLIPKVLYGLASVNHFQIKPGQAEAELKRT